MFIGYIGKTVNLKKLSKSIIVHADDSDEFNFTWFDFPPKKVVIMDYNKYIEMENGYNKKIKRTNGR